MSTLFKKFLISLILFITVIISSFSAISYAEAYRIKPVNFDISNSIIFMPIKSNVSSSISEGLKFNKLENTNGVELIIPSATVDAQPEDVSFSDGNLQVFQIKNEKDFAKVILIFKDNFNLANLKLGNINNNLVLMYGSISPYNMNYYINTYRESDALSKDYKEELLISTKVINKQNTLYVNNTTSAQSMNEINQAFANSNYGGGEVYSTYTLENLSKNNKLRSKYYIHNVTKQDETFKIVGVGNVCVQKPFLLENPTRMVFDIPNTTINPAWHNAELKLDNGDVLKIAQFNPNTARLVVTSTNAAQYIPVFSPDSQSLLVANPLNILTTHLPSHKANIVKFNFQKANKLENLLLEFDKPVSYAIKRTTKDLYIYLLNAEKYNDTQFHSVIKSTPYSDMTIHLLSTGIRLKLPVAEKDNLNTYISPDGKVFKLSFEVKKTVDTKKVAEKTKELIKKEGSITAPPKYTEKKNKNVIVIDAGHGGKDYGAIRNNVNEKDITLDVSMRLQQVLQNKGYKVYMTRTDDTYVSLEDRTIFTEGINPAAFVSVHVNSCNSESPKGIETHYYHEDSVELADAVHQKLIKKIPNTANRGLLKSRFYVINHTTVPAILVEIGFISNAAERAELTTQQRKQATAEAIADGIIEFVKSRGK